MIDVSTIGFTQTTAEHFFERLKSSGAKKLIDVRLNNTSQLSGFAKAKDLKYFSWHLCGVKYIHRPELAPTQQILDAFKKDKGDWSVYRYKFLKLMDHRAIENKLHKDLIEDSCLLCSEAKPHHCHRSLVCEYLNGKWGSQLRVRHL
ncbi:MAG TPA: DUF488 domain-containing protein [Henriciella marina]|uniref:DUF488 domain-containing protein n=1 Tax=Henriciella sp. TaxID=1968823 RepID=UPI0017DDA763|nr:DUF488 domain-containing protein [Henriciella sp.]HIG22499.1 DUF488 domain-containing protein [Henriciella sp.]HIK65794.1 DUF488 domain-containing protein [Henriciella marina]